MHIVLRSFSSGLSNSHPPERHHSSEKTPGYPCPSCPTTHTKPTKHEFILIHPFREGNGRLGRWLVTIMALQAGFPVLDFGPIATQSASQQAYFSAIRKFSGDPHPLEEWFRGLLMGQAHVEVDLEGPTQ